MAGRVSRERVLSDDFETRWGEDALYDEAFGPPDPHRAGRVDEWADHWSIREAIEICERDLARWVHAVEAAGSAGIAPLTVLANRRWCAERDQGLHPSQFCETAETGYGPTPRGGAGCVPRAPSRLWDAVPTTCWWRGTLPSSPRPGHLRVSVRHTNGARHRVYVPIPHEFERGDDWLRLTDPETAALHAQFVDVAAVAIDSTSCYGISRAS